MPETDTMYGHVPSRLLPLRLWLAAGFGPSPKLTCVQFALTAIQRPLLRWSRSSG